MGGDGRLDVSEGTVCGVSVVGGTGVERGKDLMGEIGGERTPCERSEGDDADQRALERADVRIDALGDHLERSLVGQARVRHGRRACGGWSGGWRNRRRYVGDEPGLEALAEAILERLEIARRAVGGQHDLATGVVEGVEGVEELLLGARLALEELDVVDQQDVNVTEARLEGSVSRAESEAMNSLVKASAVAERTASPRLRARSSADRVRRWVLPTPGGPQIKSGL